MDAPDDPIYRKIADEERLAIFDALQRRSEQQGTVPRAPSLWLRAHQAGLEYLGGGLLGGLIGATALVITFLVFNYFLHLLL